MNLTNKLIAKGTIPDALIRFGIRQRLAATLAPFEKLNTEQRQAALTQHINSLKSAPLAIHTQEANEQHYELPTEFFRHCLGPNLKYSSGYWDEGVNDIETSEARMLALTCERAELTDGQSILELGCGWGSLTLWMAKHYPNAKITAISNSSSQREWIESQLVARNLTNVTIKTININDFQTNHAHFDRVVSVEMFEHLKNYQRLFAQISSWLKPSGKLFVHIFTHKEFAYHYEVESEDDWMAKYFFTGGQMPSDDTFLYFQDHLSINKHWHVSGSHYEKTSNAWLQRMDANAPTIKPILAKTYGTNEVTRWWNYWRVFFMACAELWGYNHGNEWIVSHYLFHNTNHAPNP